MHRDHRCRCVPGGRDDDKRASAWAPQRHSAGHLRLGAPRRMGSPQQRSGRSLRPQRMSVSVVSRLPASQSTHSSDFSVRIYGDRSTIRKTAVLVGTSEFIARLAINFDCQNRRYRVPEPKVGCCRYGHSAQHHRLTRSKRLRRRRA